MYIIGLFSSLKRVQKKINLIFVEKVGEERKIELTFSLITQRKIGIPFQITEKDER